MIIGQILICNFNMMKKLNQFVTLDKKLVAALISQGYKPYYQGKCEQKITKFPTDESLYKTIELYWNDQLLANPRRLLMIYENLISTSNHQKK